MKKINIFWFRRDLRLHDNHALSLALQEDLPVLAIFIFDTEILDRLKEKQDARVYFIYSTLQKLGEQISQNKGTLLVLHGQVVPVWQSLIQTYSIHKVFTNHDYEPYAMERDFQVNHLLESKGISFIPCKDQVIWEKSEVMKDNGTPYIKYTPYAKKWLYCLANSSIPYYACNLSENFFSLQNHKFLSLKKTGFLPTPCYIPPSAIPQDKISQYHLHRDIPSHSGTSLLGIHLRFGTISIRELLQTALSLNKTFLSELIWREFFMQILYHFPQVVDHCFHKEYDSIPWANDAEHWERWCKGMTGYPMVDAGMRQLNETGYMHNRVRMIAASFLTKHLLIDWRWGEAYFAQKLLDYELSSNNGNWQWAASTGCDSVPYFRIFNPMLQQKRFDPQNQYIQTWVKEWNTPRYPKPVVDNKTARDKAIKVFKSLVTYK